MYRLSVPNLCRGFSCSKAINTKLELQLTNFPALSTPNVSLIRIQLPSCTSLHTFLLDRIPIRIVLKYRCSASHSFRTIPVTHPSPPTWLLLGTAAKSRTKVLEFEQRSEKYSRHFKETSCFSQSKKFLKCFAGRQHFTGWNISLAASTTTDGSKWEEISNLTPQ